MVVNHGFMYADTKVKYAYGRGQTTAPNRPPSTGGRASLWRPIQSLSPHKCTSHLGFSLGLSELWEEVELEHALVVKTSFRMQRMSRVGNYDIKYRMGREG